MTLEMFMNDEPVQVAMKKCTDCQEAFPATSEYFHWNRSKSGERKLYSKCKECKNKRTKKWYFEFEIDGGLEYTENQRKISPERAAFIHARNGVRKRGKCKWLLGKAGTPEGDAYIEYLKTITHCPDCTVEMIWYAKRTSDVPNNPVSASFDKIDSDGDYTRENVRIVCRKCNTQKSTSPADEWVGLLEVRVKKGIIKEVDPALIEYIIENKKEE
jgi:hypothetical protein